VQNSKGKQKKKKRQKKKRKTAHGNSQPQYHKKKKKQTRANKHRLPKNHANNQKRHSFKGKDSAKEADNSARPCGTNGSEGKTSRRSRLRKKNDRIRL